MGTLGSRLICSFPGASSGLGKQIVLAALHWGDRVIAAVRDVSKVQDVCSDTCKPLQLDVTAPPDVLKEKAGEALAIFGTVDVIVNNAALTILGSVEELGCVFILPIDQ